MQGEGLIPSWNMRDYPRIGLLTVLTLAAFLFPGCDGGFEPIDIACTQRPCGLSNGLEVVVTGDLPETFTITISLEGPPTIVIECSESSPCGNSIFLRDFTPDHVDITIQGESVDFTDSFMPEYELTRPNGPDCPPECRRATITVTIP